MKKIGVLGASFDPIHIGHLMLAQQAKERLGLDKVLLVPTKTPYHKKNTMLSFDKRLDMVKATIFDNEDLELSDIESRIEGNSYTFDVINLLKGDYPDDEFYFIMGTDSLINFKTWHRYEELATLATFVVFKRPGDREDQIISAKEDFLSISDSLVYFDDLQMEISSTFLRRSIKENKSIRYLVDDKTLKWIKDTGYYGKL